MTEQCLYLLFFACILVFCGSRDQTKSLTNARQELYYQVTSPAHLLRFDVMTHVHTYIALGSISIIS
jgi:hypothetical protein